MYLINAITMGPQLSYLDGVDFLERVYETATGIFDHNKQAEYNLGDDISLKRPLAKIAKKPLTSDTLVTRMTAYYELYARCKIKDMGFSFEEFMSMPRFRITELIESASEIKQKENAAADELLAEIRSNMIQKPKQPEQPE